MRKNRLAIISTGLLAAILLAACGAAPVNSAGNTHLGTWALKGELSGSPTNAAISQLSTSLSPSPEWNKDGLYAATLWIKGTGSVDLRIYSEDGSSILASRRCDATATWSFCKTDDTALETGSPVKVAVVEAYSIAGTVYIDDVFLGGFGCQVHGGDTLTNRGFEKGDSGWTIDAAGTFSVIQPGGSAVIPAPLPLTVDSQGRPPSGESGWCLPGDQAGFETWRNRPVNVLIMWPERATWDDFIVDHPIYVNHAGDPYTLVYGIPLVPEDGVTTLAQVANGDFNQKWRDLGSTLVRDGQGHCIIRLAWEFNGDWYAWSENFDAETWIKAFRQAVLSIHETAPDVKIDWTVNRGNGQSTLTGSAAEAWPGDDVVDIVGIDNYDQFGDWEQQLNGEYGLQYWLDFARQHGKKLSIPEWGINNAGGGGYGDNPDYIRGMSEFMIQNAEYIAYESYFNCNDCGVNAQLYPTGDPANTLASAEYLQLFGNP